MSEASAEAVVGGDAFAEPGVGDVGRGCGFCCLPLGDGLATCACLSAFVCEDVVLLTEPGAGGGEVAVELCHDEVDGAASFAADEAVAVVLVGAFVECEGRVVVVVPGADGKVYVPPSHHRAECFGDGGDGDGTDAFHVVGNGCGFHGQSSINVIGKENLLPCIMIRFFPMSFSICRKKLVLPVRLIFSA